jgi:MoaA/NifB/PqqE/SkfB family radical SAM enzyme
MTLQDWQQVITDAAALGASDVQFIGGEPTLSPLLPLLIRFASHLDLQVEVYSNLVSVRPALWEIFSECQVRLATSFYSPQAQIHEEITQGRHSFEKTVTHIRRAVELGLPLRVGMVKLRPDQDLAEAERLLRDLGVQRIGSDRVRGVGRGARLVEESPVSALCGRCLAQRCAITPYGVVYPCIMARSHPLGNVRDQRLEEILAGPVMAQTKRELIAAFRARTPRSTSCEPNECDPDVNPGDCDPECDPQVWPPCPPDCCPATVSGCEPDECDPDVK